MTGWTSRAPEAAFLREALLSLGWERPGLRPAAARVADWEALFWLAAGHAVAETVWAALALRGALEAVPPGPRELLRIEHAAATARNALLLAEAADLQAALRADGIASVVLKGPGLLAAHYPDIGARHVADVDLLVRPDDLERAAAAVARAGAGPSAGAPAGVEEAASPHHLARMSTRRGVALELHHRLEAGAAGQVAGIFERARDVAWQGRTLRIPSAADLAGIACDHVFGTHHGLARMVPRHVADLAVLLGGGATTWDEVEALHGAEGGRWLRASRALVEERSGQPLDAWLSASGARAGVLAGTLAGGWRRSPGAALRVLFPDRAYMAYRYGVPERAPWLPLLYLWRPLRAALFVLTGR